MKVSVCMASYNGEKFIRQQIDSILHQLSPEDELVISDDGSTDRTKEIILSYNDPRINLIDHRSTDKRNYKHSIYRATENFENALKRAGGEIIFIADQDDIWEKTRIAEVLALFEVHKVNLIINDASLIDESGNVIINSYFEKNKPGKGFTRNLIRTSYPGCCMAFDRQILIDCLPFPGRLIAHDLWIGFIAENRGKVLFTGSNLTRYRRHSGNVTPAGRKSQNSLLFKISYRVQFFIQVAWRLIELRLGRDERT